MSKSLLNSATGLVLRQPHLALGLIMLGAVAVRLAAAVALKQPLESDALAYFTMAQGLVEHGTLADHFGQHAFYSAGYPLLLALFFALAGSSVGTVIAVNLLLAAIGTWLVFALGVVLARRHEAGLLAALVCAVWLPGIWNATTAAKENLSTPLFLALALCALRIAQARRPVATAFLAGLVWGAALVTGGSALPLCVGMAVALVILWRSSKDLGAASRGGLCFVLGTLVVLSPWLYATDRMVGRPVLSTNPGFNLYLGNNPAATGRFVSIADTPMGEGWEDTRRRLGEVGTADRLQREAMDWIGQNPGRAAELGVRKLVYFWLPNVPDAEDFEASRLISSIRLVEVAQYVAIIALGFWGLRGGVIGRNEKWIVGTMIVGFWLLHAAAYVIMRYRDPAIPLLIVLASAQATAWSRSRPERGAPAHAA